MPEVAVVIPTYLRAHHVDLALTALQAQTCQDFAVVVVDDGGSDDTLSTIRHHDNLDIRYLWHPKRGMRLALARNTGARILGDAALYVFIDSDILLNPRALEVYAALAARRPYCAVGGYYRYLKPMAITADDVSRRWDSIWEMRLPEIPMELGYMPGYNPPGYDVREIAFIQGRVGEDLFLDEDRIHKQPYCLLGGNIMVPATVWHETGGFNEEMVGYGGEDGEFSLRVADAGFGFCYSKAAAGVHLAHERNPQANAESAQQVRAFIAKAFPGWHNPDGTPIFGKGGWVHPHGSRAWRFEQ